MDLRQPGEFSEDLFAPKQSVACDRLMGMVDTINERWGRGTVRAATVPVSPDWAMRREMRSQSYTTRIDQLWKVKCQACLLPGWQSWMTRSRCCTILTGAPRCWKQWPSPVTVAGELQPSSGRRCLSL